MIPGIGEKASVEQFDSYVLPGGLVDVHCHIGMGANGAVSDEEAVEQAIADRDAGVLLVRDAGVATDTHWIDERADLPRVIRAGRHIARPVRYLRNFAVELDDVALLPEEVARQSKAGDGWVKIVADWIDRSMGVDAVISPLWPADVLADAIAAAHENGARVTAHTFSHEAVDPLLDAGIDCIEHGTGMDSDQIAEAAQRGIPITPTLMQVDYFDEFVQTAGTKYPAYAAQVARMYANREAQVRAFVDAGVQLLPGSDSGGTIIHGAMPQELQRWVDAEIPMPDIVDFATWKAREYLNAPAEDGDFAVYAADPRSDLTTLLSPVAVVLRGIRVA